MSLKISHSVLSKELGKKQTGLGCIFMIAIEQKEGDTRTSVTEQGRELSEKVIFGTQW